jgi:hypothetical protein
MMLSARASRLTAVVALTAILAVAPHAMSAEDDFDHTYRAYGAMLRAHVEGARVDYATLLTNRAQLDAVVETLGGVTTDELAHWDEPWQIAYWINAYNAFTLQAIIDHYPIRSRFFRTWFNWVPRNSIKQIDGVWTHLRWRAAGADMTLDDIEHETLRKRYEEPRIHFAINCASVGCPPLRPEAYVGDRLDLQLILAARDYLASEQGVTVDGTTLHVTHILDWWNEDFIDQYAHLLDGGSERDRVVLGVIGKYGPPEASRLARSGTARIRFLPYDWSLNDTEAR